MLKKKKGKHALERDSEKHKAEEKGRDLYINEWKSWEKRKGNCKELKIVMQKLVIEELWLQKLFW